MNKTGKQIEANMSIFVNGIQMDMLNITDDKRIKNYEFVLNNDETKILPIKPILDNLKNGVNIININIVTENNINAIDANEKLWMKTTYNYTLKINKNGNEFLKDDTPFKEYENNIVIENLPNENQFIINNTKEDLEKQNAPKNFIKAQKNSKVYIPINLGGGKATDILLYGTLNNNQLLLNNSNVLYYKLMENKFLIDNIEIKVPDKAGKYELLFYAVFNLDKTNLNNENLIETRVSHRVTIIVE